MHKPASQLPRLKPIPKLPVTKQRPPQGQPQEDEGLFLIKTASRWCEEASLKPRPRMLFSEFWHEGEVCILFADANLGKSILAVQIANSISRGERIPAFKLDAPAQKVLYFDFELSDKQFEVRYSIDFKDHYFKTGGNDNLLRAEINPDAEIPKEFASFEDFLHHSLERAVVETEARVVIIDNITYLSNETEKARDALPLMKQLKALKKKYGLSILVLAHTPKRDISKPITRNDLSGSKMLINFCDSCFAIGESALDAQTRYIKQVKQRQTEQLYGTESVVLCQISKPHNFLQFEFIDLGSELQHLRHLSDDERGQQVREALELRSQGVPNVEIARRFGVSEGAVRKWVKKAEEKGSPF